MKTFRRWVLIALAGAVSASFAIAQGTAAQGPPDNSTPTVSKTAQQCAAAAKFNQEELMDSREVQIASHQLYRDTQHLSKMHSMWVTYKDGEFGFVRWVTSPTMDEARWNGPLPACIVAIIYAVPPGRSHQPSHADHQLASGKTIKGLSVPVYVLHRDRINKAVPGTYEVAKVHENGWVMDFAPQKGELAATSRPSALPSGK